jgi:hypothetical protein
MWQVENIPLQVHRLDLPYFRSYIAKSFVTISKVHFIPSSKVGGVICGKVHLAKKKTINNKAHTTV